MITIRCAPDPLLGGQAQSWATPNCLESAARAGLRNQTKGGRELTTDAMNWATPMAADDGDKMTPNSRINGLIGDARNFPTPVANDAMGTRNNTCETDRKKHDVETLSDAMLNWPTTTSRDWKVGDLPAESRVGSEALTASAESFADQSSRPTEPTTDDGLNLLLSVWTRPTCPRLSAAFQWWLLGMPHPRLMFCDSEETPSAQSRRLGHCSTWRAACLEHLRNLVNGICSRVHA